MYPATKFRPPSVRRHAVVRDDVLEALRSSRNSTVVVWAPAGFGKTTVAAQWVATLDKSGSSGRVWVSIDEDDSDPAGLWGAICAAASAAGVFAHTPALQLGDLRSSVLVPLLDAFTASERDWVLILDDVHLIAHEDAIASLDWFLGRLPENLRVALLGRTPIDLPAVRRLRARGDVVEVLIDQLRLDEKQTTRILGASCQVPVTAEYAARVNELTGGWPAAVSLLGSALDHGLSLDRLAVRTLHDVGGVRELVTQGLAGNDPRDMALLRSMSVLERFDAQILSAVLPDGRAWEVAMDVADRTGLIATVDDDRRWWRMHHLVREILHTELDREDPELRRELHRRAFLAFEEENDISATVHHLLDAEDYDTLADILANVRASSMVPRQALGLGWLDRIPASALDRHPRLAFWEAWATATGGDQQRRDRALARGRLAASARSIDAFDNWDDVEDFVVASACFGDVGASHRAADRFLRKYTQNHPLAELASLRLATMLYLEGRCEEALRVLEDLDQGPPLTRPLRLLVPAYRALCELERGDIEAAAIQIERCSEARIAYKIGQDPIYLPAEQAVARFQTERGDANSALATVTAGLDTGRSHGDSVLVVPHLLLEVARAQRALGLVDEAVISLNQAEELLGGALDAGALPNRIALMRADLGASKPPRIRENLSRRELEVLALLPTQMSATQIAAELFISANTARTHIKSIYRKLGVTTRPESVDAARRAGLVAASQR